MSDSVQGLLPPSAGVTGASSRAVTPRADAAHAEPASPAFPVDAIGQGPPTPRGLDATLADAGPPSPAARTSASPSPTPAHAWDGWSDAQRGVNRNLGDTEAALHLFYERHPSLGGKPPADGTPEAAAMKQLHLWADAHRLAQTADPAETNWSPDSRDITVTAADTAEAKGIFLSQHPELKGKLPAKGPLATQYADLQRYVAQNRYNATLDRAVSATPATGLTPKMLKSQLIEESSINPNIGTNSVGAMGLAQIMPDTLDEGGITAKQALHDPLAAIGAAARIDASKQAAIADLTAGLANTGGADAIQFTLGTYNAGQGNIADAVKIAYADGLAAAKKHGLTGKDAAAYATDYASRWNDIAGQTGRGEPPLRQALGSSGYQQTSSYVDEIVTRATQ